VKSICSFKIIRNLKFFRILDHEDDHNKDRMWLSFDSGDQEAFEYDGNLQKLFLIESEKQKEHEAPLTGLDYNRNLELFVSSC